MKLYTYVLRYDGGAACESASNTSKLEAEIDQLVYQLYGLTENEIKIVEGEK